MFTILMLAAEKSKDTFIAPIGIGLSLFVVELAGVNYSGGAINPARSFGPCVAGAHFTGYHWIYWLGPSMGAVIAAGFYHFIKVCVHFRGWWGLGWETGTGCFGIVS
jgi:aquaporin related protein